MRDLSDFGRKKCEKRTKGIERDVCLPGYVLHITIAVHPVFLLNYFPILLCVRVLYSVCVCGNAEGGQRCMVMCVQS